MRPQPQHSIPAQSCPNCGCDTWQINDTPAINPDGVLLHARLLLWCARCKYARAWLDGYEAEMNRDTHETEEK